MCSSPTEQLTERSGATPSAAECLLAISLDLAVSEQTVDALLHAARELGTAFAAEARVEWLGGGEQIPPSPENGKLSLSIDDRGLLIAYLHLQRRNPFTGEERRLLDAVALGMSHSLAVLSQRTESRLLATLSSAITAGESPEAAMVEALSRLNNLLGGDAAALLQMLDANTDNRVLAATGAWSGGEAVPAGHHDTARSAATAEGPQLHSGNIVSCPMVARSPVRFGVLLCLPASCLAPRLHLQALRRVALVMAPFLDMHWRIRVLTSLLELHHASEETSTDEMYRRMLDSAIQLIPGADSGTLLVRRNQHQQFILKAARSFEPDELVGTTLEPLEEQAW